MGSPSYAIGFVYVLTNESMPGIVKIGETSRLSEIRAKEIYTTGVPTPFAIEYRTAASRWKGVEKKAHDLLESYRVNSSREFFRVSVNEAINAVRYASIEVAGIDSWKHSKPYVLKNEDRLALTLKAGQIFAVLSYEDFSDAMVGRATIIDLWQAHSNGDLLEIYITDSPCHISGFSDDDPGNTDDPVPYLNREKTAINGLINGRERLTPGERLVWLPAPEDADIENSVVFEMGDHCQVISRTYSPLPGPHGLPLLLNHFMHTEVGSAADRSIRNALALPIPRSWAPRQSRDSTWAVIGTEQQNPDYWLPQLKRR